MRLSDKRWREIAWIAMLISKCYTRGTEPHREYWKGQLVFALQWLETPDMTEEASDAEYRAGYSYAAGYHD